MEKTETNEEKVKRLAQNAGNIVNMLKAQLKGPNGLDLKFPIMFASGLSGIACHEAVKALHEPFEQVTLKDGRHFYFGDPVNKYLLESDLSVYSFIRAVTGYPEESMAEVVKLAAENIGNDAFTVAGISADSLYKAVKDCWDGIFENMTRRYCSSPDEWPVLYSIVLQNLMLTALEVGAPKNEVARLAAICAVVPSRMDTDSLLKT